MKSVEGVGDVEAVGGMKGVGDVEDVGGMKGIGDVEGIRGVGDVDGNIGVPSVILGIPSQNIGLLKVISLGSPRYNPSSSNI